MVVMKLNASPGPRVSSGSGHVSPAELPGAVLTSATAAAAGRAVPCAVTQASRAAPTQDEGPADLVSSAAP